MKIKFIHVNTLFVNNMNTDYYATIKRLSGYSIYMVTFLTDDHRYLF